jgi:hypothetical protein
MRVAASVISAAIAILARGPDLFADDLRPEQVALKNWFECVECTADDLRAVVNLGPTVEKALISALRDGLSAVKRAELRQQLLATYQESGHLPMTEEQFVDTYLSNADAAHRSRAAIALGKLRTPAAIVALNRASVDSRLRADVREASKRALQP